MSLSIDNLKKQVNDYIIKHIDIPTIDELEDEYDIFGLSKATNDQLKEYLEMYGGYKSYLESRMAQVESMLGMYRSQLDVAMNHKVSELSKEYKTRPTKELIQGRAMSESQEIQDFNRDVTLLNAIFVRVRGMKESYTTAYNTVSRVVALRENNPRERTF